MSYQGDHERARVTSKPRHEAGSGRVRNEEHTPNGHDGKHDIGVEANKERVAQMTLALVNQARVIVEQQRELERLRAVEARVYPNRRRVKQI